MKKLCWHIELSKNITIYSHFMPYAKNKFQINYRLNCKNKLKGSIRGQGIGKSRQNWKPTSYTYVIM